MGNTARAIPQPPFLMRAVLVDDAGRRIERPDAADHRTRSHQERDQLLDSS